MANIHKKTNYKNTSIPKQENVQFTTRAHEAGRLLNDRFLRVRVRKLSVHEAYFDMLCLH